ncbi:MAG: hypothetical protein J6F30_04670 [Cellulosilyticum sp.]|nr:hypothetical protein [Cellulosilyticum sp.]
MTLEEAIKRYADNSEYERAHGNLQGCMEFKQLLEWLKELEHLRNLVSFAEYHNVSIKRAKEELLRYGVEV